MGDAQDEFLQSDVNSLDGRHRMQVLDVGSIDGGAHAGGKGAVSTIHVAVENGAVRSRDVTVGFIWNEAAVQHPRAFRDLTDFVGPSVNEFDYFCRIFFVNLK